MTNTNDEWKFGFWEALPFVLSILCVILLAAFYSELPSEVRIVFNTPGKNEAHLGPKMHLWVSPFVSTILAIALTALSRNIQPHHSDSKRESSTQVLHWMLRSLASGIALVALVFTYLSIAEVQRWPLPNRDLVQPLAAVFFTLVPFIGMWKLFRAQRRKRPVEDEAK